MNPDDYLAPEIYRQITGFEKLIGFFGYWPSFHDAEVLALWLDRRGQVDWEGPIAVLKLLTQEWRQNPVTGHTQSGPPGLVEFRFTAVEDLHVTGFNYQNAIQALDWQREQAKGFPARWRVSFPGLFGVSGTFTCQEAELVSAASVNPEDFPARP